MACWRVLELSSIEHVPHLLIKPKFAKDSYTVFLTDLSSIWSEELDLNGIIDRTSQQESPIEVSKQDTSQLAILLETVRNTLTGAENASCRLVRREPDGLVLHTSVALPEPLGSLSWKFELQKQTPITLKNELILPLLVSSHVQHSQVRSLTTLIDEKDKAITRLVDQFEASNLDLATAFPSVGGSKAGRRLVKREQAAKQIPALRPFERDAWKAETGELQDVDLSSFGLFQEALSDCTPTVPSSLESKDDQDAWWTTLSSSLQSNSPPAKRRKVTKQVPSKSPPPQEPSDDETEDEFETHEHFYQREAAKNPPRKSPSPQVSNDEATEDEDLDAPPRSQSQKQVPTLSPDRSTNVGSPEPHHSPSPKPAAATITKTKGFRIGGMKARKSAQAARPPNSTDAQDQPMGSTSPERAQATVKGVSSVSPTKTRKTFKIGGKSKDGPSIDNTAKETRGLEERLKGKEHERLPSRDGSASKVATQDQKASIRSAEIATVEEEHEETPEEKAERRRRELKRKNEEELAKKQAQKKKKRF